MKNFKTLDLIKWGWEDFKKNIWIASISFGIFTYLFYRLSDITLGGIVEINELTGEVNYNTNLLKMGSVLIYYILTTYVYAGFYREIIRTTGNNQKFCVKNVFVWPENFKHLLNYFGLLFLLAFSVFIVIGGSMLLQKYNLVVSGLIFILIGVLFILIFYYYTFFCPYIILENRAGIIGSIKKSVSMVKGHMGLITRFWFWLLLFVILFYFGLIIVNYFLTFVPIFGLIIFHIIWAGFTIFIVYSIVHLYRKLDPEVATQKVE